MQAGGPNQMLARLSSSSLRTNNPGWTFSKFVKRIP
jgi:hypothetical protein